jgi:hypothetical protein
LTPSNDSSIASTSHPTSSASNNSAAATDDVFDCAMVDALIAAPSSVVTSQRKSKSKSKSKGGKSGSSDAAGLTQSQGMWINGIVFDTVTSLARLPALN